MELFAADGHDAGGCERVTGKSGMRPTATCSTDRSASRTSTPRCAECCSTRGSSTGRRSRRQSSGRCFARSWSRVERRTHGAHYTTEKNILKVIEPVFLDDLRAEFRRLQGRRDGRAVPDLQRFRDRLGTLRLFDPACGCGNFLIIAYRELRTLEIDVLREIASRATATQLALAVQSVVEVDQFYGMVHRLEAGHSTETAPIVDGLTLPVELSVGRLSVLLLRPLLSPLSATPDVPAPGLPTRSTRERIPPERLSARSRIL